MRLPRIDSLVLRFSPLDPIFLSNPWDHAAGFWPQIPDCRPLFEELIPLEAGPRFPAVSDGYWILLKPLRAGVHTISFGVDFDNDGVADQGVNYTLLVVARHDDHDGDGDDD